MSVRRAIWLLATLMSLVAACSGGAAGTGTPSDPAVVQTRSGGVRGLADDSVRVFSGIPYAAAPLGDRRFREPAPLTWPGIRDATTPGAWCPQGNYPGRRTQPVKSEDCLFLNITAPRHATGKLPVLVWIHGGAFVAGAGDIYGARTLAARGGILVVTLNYRLGTLGFLADRGLSATVGNYGLLDQQAALRWVRDNIASFGGDPEQVTIAGQSAGGMSVCDHLVAPGSAGLYRAAIIESGPCQEQATVDVAVRDTIAYEREIGCGDRASVAACLRALPAGRLRTTPRFTGVEPVVGPVTGTPELPVSPMDAASAARVPVLIGTNADEGTWFQLTAKPVPTAGDYRRLLAESFGARADDIARTYPLARFSGNVTAALAAVTTDAKFACPADVLARGLAARGPVYAYEFADRDNPQQKDFPAAPLRLGATHGLELGYLFDYGLDLSAAQRKLSDQMIGYWARFVQTGSPNGVDGQPDWPAFGESGRRLTLAPPGPRLSGDFVAEHHCSFWR